MIVAPLLLAALQTRAFCARVELSPNTTMRSLSGAPAQLLPEGISQASDFCVWSLSCLSSDEEESASAPRARLAMVRSKTETRIVRIAQAVLMESGLVCS
jgi:hypothetical protein